MKSHESVITDFVRKGTGGRGHYVFANEADHAVFSVGNMPWRFPGPLPLAVRLRDGGFLANGVALNWPRRRHQNLVLRELEHANEPFGVVPFDAITAAWTDGVVRDYFRGPLKVSELRREIQVVVPSAGEKWQEVMVRDKYGRERFERVHTLGDSVLMLKERFYLSGVDETGTSRGGYFLAMLITDRPPQTLGEAYGMLKPEPVRAAEAQGKYVRRQGEWFAIPTNLTTSQLMRDVERGIAVRREQHVLGRAGHHRLEEAVIYRVGPQRGEVYARGVLRHTNGEHRDLDLGFRWHRLIHNVQGASYSFAGNFD
jgi:hypothetical protein